MPDALFEDKERIEEEFLAFLHDVNFPENSVFRGPCFHFQESGRRKHGVFAWLNCRVFGADPPEEAFPCYADMAILDLESREYVALIEFRLQLNDEVERQMADFFREILDRLETKPPVFLATPLLTGGFRISQLRENGLWQELPKRNFPSHATLVAGRAAEQAVIREARQGKALNHFTITCHALAGILGLISIASIGRLASLTNAEMLLFALAALLVIAPHSLDIRLSNAKNKTRLLRTK